MIKRKPIFKSLDILRFFFLNKDPLRLEIIDDGYDYRFKRSKEFENLFEEAANLAKYETVFTGKSCSSPQCGKALEIVNFVVDELKEQGIDLKYEIMKFFPDYFLKNEFLKVFFDVKLSETYTYGVDCDALKIYQLIDQLFPVFLAINNKEKTKSANFFKIGRISKIIFENEIKKSKSDFSSGKLYRCINLKQSQMIETNFQHLTQKDWDNLL